MFLGSKGIFPLAWGEREVTAREDVFALNDVLVPESPGSLRGSFSTVPESRVQTVSHTFG